MLNCIAKMIYHLLPKAFPHNLAKGDVFDLIKLLKDTDFDAVTTPRIYNQDLAGFFTSIDTDRFIDSWRLTLNFLASTMSTDPDEIFSVKATPTNTTGDVVKGRTCRTLNLTRKIFIRDIERIILMSLKRWPSSPSAPPSTLKSEAPLWAHHLVRLYAWWLSPSPKKSGTKPTIQLWPPWISLLDSFDT